MRAELPPIAKLSQQILVSIEQAVIRFARSHKYGVGADLRREAMRVARCVHRAWRERSRQLQRVHELAEAIDDLKITLQLAQGVDAFRSFGEFEALARLVSDIGRQCGGWLKQLHSKGQNGQASPGFAQRAPILSSRSASSEATP